MTNLEGQMLKEVGSAVGLVRLGARASVNPHANSGCLGPGGVLGSNLIDNGQKMAFGGDSRSIGRSR
jgi:hypothetical protein